MEPLIGIPSTYLGLLGIFAAVVVIVLSIGWMYDVTFGLWREHLTVVQERNPFTTYKLNAPFGIILAQTNTILRKISEDDEEVQRHAEAPQGGTGYHCPESYAAGPRAAAGRDGISLDQRPS